MAYLSRCGDVQNSFLSVFKFYSYCYTDEERRSLAIGHVSQNMFHVNQVTKVVKYGILSTKSRPFIRLLKLKSSGK